MANEQKQVVLTSRIQSRNDTAATWMTKNPVLLKGEIGIENDSRKIKLGDGVTVWKDLPYASAHEVVLNSSNPQFGDVDYDQGAIWINQTSSKVFVLVAKTDTAVWIRLANATELAVVAEAQIAQRLKMPRTISLSGAGTGNTSFDGSANADIVLVLKNSGEVKANQTVAVCGDSNIEKASKSECV